MGTVLHPFLGPPFPNLSWQLLQRTTQQDTDQPVAINHRGVYDLEAGASPAARDRAAPPPARSGEQPAEQIFTIMEAITSEEGDATDGERCDGDEKDGGAAALGDDQGGDEGGDRSDDGGPS
jgi:hypothetical protein